jgi:DNA replication protein
MKDPRFNGFPDSGLATTVPNLFFAQVMPHIDDPAELVVSAYFFYAVGQSDRARKPRFVTRRELAADVGLLRSLAGLCGEPSPSLGGSGFDLTGGGTVEPVIERAHDALDEGLRLAVQRRTLVRAVAETEELFAVNTPSNRRALEALAGARVDIEEPLPAADGAAIPNIFALYEENVGTITPLIAEQLQEAEGRFPAAWLEAAFREAVANNKRSWRYVERILSRWETEGPDYEEPERDSRVEWLERRYREGKRRLGSRT